MPPKGRKVLRKPAQAPSAEGALDGDAEGMPQAEEVVLRKPAGAQMAGEALNDDAEGGPEPEEAPTAKGTVLRKPARAWKAGFASSDAEGAAQPDEALGTVLRKPASAEAAAQPEEAKAEQLASAEQDTVVEDHEPRKPKRAKLADKETAQDAAKAAEEKVDTKDAKAAKAPSKTQVLIKAVHDTISSIPYAAAPVVGVHLHPGALTSMDQDGFPSSRTVVPTFLAKDLSEIHLNTKRGTRKLEEVEANPKASLHFQDQRGRGGWATLKGDIKVRPGGDEDLVELVLKPERCEVMSYVEGIMADEEGWKPARMVRVKGEGWRATQ